MQIFTDEYAVPTRRSPNLWLRGAGILAAALLVSVLAGTLHGPDAAEARGPVVLAGGAQLQGLERQLAATQSELDVQRLKNTRAEAIERYSAAYQIPADLAAAIYDNALSAGIDPGVGFQLVKVESEFKANARSSAGALGYTQLQLATARGYEPWVDQAALFDRGTNLRIGFRFLKDLIRQYHGDVHLALLAYNRGPGRINEALAYGDDPDNGYSRAVLKDRPAALRKPVKR
ncbi:MAG TPA: transglycosylase SLT domain-containing protein [Gemmatimonadales bacterium]|nr:transglycosylase SLT domain-containing protein [Gemmatimonadales bacterium]